jgi:hypothetical protein
MSTAATYATPISSPPPPSHQQQMSQQPQHSSDVFDRPDEPAAVPSDNTNETKAASKAMPPHVVMTTSPGRPTFDAFDGASLDLMTPSLRHLTDDGKEKEDSKDVHALPLRPPPAEMATPLRVKIRGIIAMLMLSGLVTYELISFEWKDWRDRGMQHGANGFTVSGHA